MALAQTLFGLVATASYKSVALHALQFRDPRDIDWQSHFTAGLLINSVAALIVLAIAAVLFELENYAAVAAPLAVLSILLLIEVPATLRYTMIQTAHDWVRLRTLALIGTVIGLITSIAIAAAGGGVWALLAGPILFGIPAVIDLFFVEKWRPTFVFSRARFGSTVSFGLNRAAASFVTLGRGAVEQTAMTGLFNFSALGIYTRSFGLSSILAGRIGLVVSQTLYPVITRAEAGSERFRRISGLVLSSVSWTTIPAAVFLGMSADGVVVLLYGARWSEVAPLLPAVAAAVSFAGIAVCASQLLLANKRARLCLWIDLFVAALGIAAIALVLPSGIETYIFAAATVALVGLISTLAVLRVTGGIDTAGIVSAFFPPIFGATAATGLIFGLRGIVGYDASVWFNLGLEAIGFAAVYLLTLRICFPSAVSRILDVAPLGSRLRRALMLSR